MIIGGKEVKHSTGYFELRTYDGPKPVYESLKGATPAEAEYKRKTKPLYQSANAQHGSAGFIRPVIILKSG